MPVEIFPDLLTISVKDAVTNYLNGTCEVVEFYDIPILSNGKPIEHKTKGVLFWPSVIMYKAYQKQNINTRLTRENLYYRDHFCCQFCGDPLTIKNTTMDHVIPKSKGGPKNWMNIVASCDECNKQKGDSLPNGRWKPRNKPYIPTFYDLLEIRKKQPLVVDHESWIPFLPKWESEIIVRGQKPVEAKDAFANDNETAEVEELVSA